MYRCKSSDLIKRLYFINDNNIVISDLSYLINENEINYAYLFTNVNVTTFQSVYSRGIINYKVEKYFVLIVLVILYF